MRAAPRPAHRAALVLAKVAVALGFAALAALPAFAQAGTTVYLVRHAEKAAAPVDDPPLTDAGNARAGALVEALSGARIGAIISTPYLRTTSTARPLATATGVAVETVAVTGGVAAHAGAVADAVRRHAGKAVVVVGHSNTVPAIAAALGAPRVPDFCDEEYDHILVVELAASGPPRFTRLRYGAPSPKGSCAPMQAR